MKAARPIVAVSNFMVDIVGKEMEGGEHRSVDRKARRVGSQMYDRMG